MNNTRWRIRDVNMAAHSVSEKSPGRGRKTKKQQQDLGFMDVDDLQNRRSDLRMFQGGAGGTNNEELLRRVFGDRINFESLSTATSSPSRKPIALNNVEFYIDKELDEISQTVPSADINNGRIGPKKAMFDVTSNVGSFVIDRDKLGVSSQSNFSSIRANVCVYRGKWQYELMLGSKGVMQLGWATLHCQFSQEKGVGDTPDSYAYDGNRVRKWNMATFKYGESWLTGDIIGCTIDLDIGAIHFYRNGRDLGEAFNNVRLGPNIAYFPSISLAFSENLVANFGATPMKYPIRGYRPLQDPPHQDLARANKLIFWLSNLLPIMLEDDKNMSKSPRSVQVLTQPSPHSRSSTLMLIAAHILHRLGPLLMTMYVTEGCLLSFLSDLNQLVPGYDVASCLARRPHIQKLLDLMWALLEDFEIKQCLENLIISLLTAYRFSPISADFVSQHKYLALTLAVLRHQKTRLMLLRTVLFDKIKFPIFLHIKPLDNDSLAEAVPEVWWQMKAEKLPYDPDLPSEKHKTAYQRSILKMKKSLQSLEAIQGELLKVLLDNKENSVDTTTRHIFLGKFREFLRENMTGSRLHPVHLCPLPVTLCFFHRLIQALRYYWDHYAMSREAPAFVTTSANAFIPTRVFYDDSINFYEIQRIGGLLSHLKKALKDEVSQALGIRFSGPNHVVSKDSMTSSSAPPSPRSGIHHRSHPDENFPSTSQLSRVITERKFSLPNAAHADLVSMSPFNGNSQSSEHPTFAQLVEILDGVVLLYHIAAHKQLAKMCSLRESMQDYVQALQDTEIKLARCSEEDLGPDVKSALLQAKTVFMEKLAEQSRHYAWVQAVIYSREKQEDVYWLLQVLLRTLNRASLEGPLLSFVPDYYIEACINSCSALRTYFNPINPSAHLPGYQETLVEVGLFLSTHFADKRVINADIKDTLIQAVASFVCQPVTLSALEAMPRESRLMMIRALLQPYENRAWAQSNWILVRLWKGCGFGFRYTQPPHMVKRLGPKPQLEPNLSSQYHKPCPSVLFQKHVSELLAEESNLAIPFLNSVLNQLNWSFSEFIGMLQEIQNASNRPERVFIDSRQLKICATCYDLALALLRVLEMIVHVSPHLFTDPSNASAELLLGRLCQLLCQVLNRVTSRSGCFDHVVALEISGLETVDHYPIIAAVTGILIQLILRGTQRSQSYATAALLAEPSFQLSSIEFLLGLPERAALRSSLGGKRQFTLKNYEEVVQVEVHEVERLLNHLIKEQQQMQAETQVAPEEELCTICYAHQISTIFNPCGHQSCRACIAHHLMNKSECFFCKAIIETVEDLDGKTLHDLTKKTVTPPST